MTETELIDDILEREGGFTNDPVDRGGATNFGITAASWGAHRRLGRAATPDEVRAITREEAVDFYHATYVSASPFQAIAYAPLRVQLIDFAVNSGTPRAVRWLQRTLAVPVTGVVDAATIAAAAAYPGSLVNNALVAARLAMYQRIVAGDVTQAKYLRGWINRAVSFSDFGAAGASRA
jgi:lysozyme family protein